MEENKKELEIDINKLIIRVHNKIAIWNNQDASAEDKSVMLKVLSHDIVTDIITTAFSQLQGVRIKEKIVSMETPKPKGLLNRIFGKNK